MSPRWLFCLCFRLSPPLCSLSICLLLTPPRLPSPSPPAENHSAPPDVTGYSSDSSHSHTERHHMANMGTIARNTQKYGNAERMETGDGKGHLRHRVAKSVVTPF